MIDENLGIGNNNIPIKKKYKKKIKKKVPSYMSYYETGKVKTKNTKKKKKIYRFKKRCECGARVPYYHHTKCNKCWLEESRFKL